MFRRAARTCFAVAMARLPSGSAILRSFEHLPHTATRYSPPQLDYLISIRTSVGPGQAVGPTIRHSRRGLRTFGAPSQAEIGRAQLQQAPELADITIKAAHGGP